MTQSLRRPVKAKSTIPVLPHRPSELILHTSPTVDVGHEPRAIKLNFAKWIITWGSKTYVCRTAKGMLGRLRKMLHTKSISSHDVAPLMAILALAQGKVSEAFQHLSLNPEIGKSFDRTLSVFFSDGQQFSDEFHKLGYDLAQAGL